MKETGKKGNRMKKSRTGLPSGFSVRMEHMGFEPTASTMRMWRAPNCANAPGYGSKEARTPDLSRVRRTLIPAELCFHTHYYSTLFQEINTQFPQYGRFSYFLYPCDQIGPVFFSGKRDQVFVFRANVYGISVGICHSEKR